MNGLMKMVLNSHTAVVLISSIKMINKRSYLVFVFLCFLLPESFSQNSNEVIKFSGSASISDNFYSASGIDPRQPGNMLTGILPSYNM